MQLPNTKLLKSVLAFCAIFAATITNAAAVEGDIDWGGWKFTYSTNNIAGLSLIHI